MKTVRFTQTITNCSAWDFALTFRDHLDAVVDLPTVPNIKEVQTKTPFPTTDDTTITVSDWTSHLYDIPFFLRRCIDLLVNPKLWSWTEVKKWDTTDPKRIKVDFGVYQYVTKQSPVSGPQPYIASFVNTQANSSLLWGAAMQGTGEMIIEDVSGCTRFTMTNSFTLDPGAAGLSFLNPFAGWLEGDIAKKIEENTRDVVNAIAKYSRDHPDLNPRPVLPASPLGAATRTATAVGPGPVKCTTLMHGIFHHDGRGVQALAPNCNSATPLGHGTFSANGRPVQFHPTPGASAPRWYLPRLGRR
jgi:hypothetical protein